MLPVLQHNLLLPHKQNEPINQRSDQTTPCCVKHTQQAPTRCQAGHSSPTPAAAAARHTVPCGCAPCVLVSDWCDGYV
jgi:hypothetical protein